jgi:hypothetical protein
MIRGVDSRREDDMAALIAIGWLIAIWVIVLLISVEFGQNIK